jgi:hypothetical protein
MGVGPPARSGRDQMAAVRRFMADPSRKRGEIVAICCSHGGGAAARHHLAANGVPYSVDCAGNLHTSVIEVLLREGTDVARCADTQGPRSGAAAESRTREGPDRQRRRGRAAAGG